MKPFYLEAAKRGEPGQTRDGRKNGKLSLPWWWNINPWLALSRRDRAYYDALDTIREVGIELHKLVESQRRKQQHDATADRFEQLERVAELANGLFINKDMNGFLTIQYETLSALHEALQALPTKMKK